MASRHMMVHAWWQYMETACSSSQVAISLACHALRNGDCDYAIIAAGNAECGKDLHLSLQVGGYTDIAKVDGKGEEGGGEHTNTPSLDRERGGGGGDVFLGLSSYGEKVFHDGVASAPACLHEL